MPNKTILDISCENFDLYFARQIEAITPEAKESLPRDIAFKLFRKGGQWDSKSTSRLGFMAKLFVLLRALRKRFFLVIEDNQNGMSFDQFMELRKGGEHREYTMELAEGLMQGNQMILANKELSDYFQYTNFLSTSPAYNFLLKNKNVPANKVTQSEKEMGYIVRFLVFWEGNKKNLVANTGMLMPEIYVLMCLFDGGEISGATIYNSKFRRAYQSSQGKIKLAFGTLQAKGYITKYGDRRGAKMQITPLGKDILRQSLIKYAINC